jgi:tripartite-type tricarboxylate transporter receptor subunit TctC
MPFPATRRQLLALAAGSIAAPFAQAQAWPARPIRLVVPFPPGGLIDNMARLIGPRLSAELGQAVVIDNKPGVGGNLGAAEVSRAPADGHTLLMASPPLTIGPALFGARLPYKPEALEPVALIGRVPNVLIVNPASGIDNRATLLQRAKAAPGRLNYASNGNGTSLHLSAELLKASTGAFITHIPYRGAAAAVTALLANEVDMAFENVPSVLGQVTAGRVRALAVTTRNRSKALPAVPTLVELGVPDFDVSAYFGVAAPAGLPAEVRSRLEAALQKVASDSTIVASMERAGADVVFTDAAASARFMAADAATWRRVVGFANIRVDG